MDSDELANAARNYDRNLLDTSIFLTGVLAGLLLAWGLL